MNGAAESLNVLSLQPWHGGSHRQFSDGWESRSRHQFTTLGLPARNWKWRMRHASIEFADHVHRLSADGHSWDAVICTDMMNAAEFQTLAKPIRDLPLVVYFHENQFAYPNRGNQQHDQHFLFTNFVSALAADQIWFNSQFNLDSMVAGLKEQASHWPDFAPHKQIDALADRSKIVPPPIESPPLVAADHHARRQKRVSDQKPLHIVWAARWEHDKNPEDLLKALRLLKQQRVPFSLSVVGKSYRQTPATFESIQSEFELQIEHWGFQEDRESYWKVLASADVFVSTATHEFFGLSVVEAISVGAWPLLPDRLAYPEVLNCQQYPDRRERFLYDGSVKSLASRIRQLHSHRDCWDWIALQKLSKEISHCFSFRNRVPIMDEMLNQLMEKRKIEI
jgi:glycosyltransferase involved in cell wall biosynthesis